MIIVFKKTLQDYSRKQRSANYALNKWYKLAKAADWSKHADVKNSFPDVDYVGNDRYVFNIKGNSFRLVAMIFFDKRTLFVRFIGTHSEYDQINCSTI